MKPLSEQDHYETLEVAREAGLEEIERAYRLARATYADDSLAGLLGLRAGRCRRDPRADRDGLPRALGSRGAARLRRLPRRRVAAGDRPDRGGRGRARGPDPARRLRGSGGRRRRVRRRAPAPRSPAPWDRARRGLAHHQDQRRLPLLPGGRTLRGAARARLRARLRRRLRVLHRPGSDPRRLQLHEGLRGRAARAAAGSAPSSRGDEELHRGGGRRRRARRPGARRDHRHLALAGPPLDRRRPGAREHPPLSAEPARAARRRARNRPARGAPLPARSPSRSRSRSCGRTRTCWCSTSPPDSSCIPRPATRAGRS